MTLQRRRSAIILAAGYSRRMQQFKPLMTLGGQTVLERVVSLYRGVGVMDIRVVTGFRSEAVRSALAAQPVSVVHNPAHAAGMFSSVLAGVHTLPTEVQSFFIHPLDIPLVRPHSLQMLMDAFDSHPSTVVYPMFDDQRGHPPLIHAEMQNAIFAHDGSGGLRALLHRFDSKALDVQVADEGVLLDMDTPNAYQRLSSRLARSYRLTGAECRALMEKVCNLPEPVVAHANAVAQVAVALAEAVNRRRPVVDVALIQSAARVHDVARLEKSHAVAGASLLRAMGFPAMADIVGVHMDINLIEASPLDEAQVVHLADKLVSGIAVVNLAQRFDASLRKYNRDPKVFEKISQRRRIARLIQEKVERTSGEKIDQTLKKSELIIKP